MIEGKFLMLPYEVQVNYSEIRIDIIWLVNICIRSFAPVMLLQLSHSTQDLMCTN